MFAAFVLGAGTIETGKTAALVMVAMMNAARLDAPLALSDDLQARAERRAQHFCTHPMSHDGWQAFFENTAYTAMAENLAKGHKDAATAQAALLGSPPHRANILNREFKRVGIGYACGVYVQFFAN